MDSEDLDKGCSLKAVKMEKKTLHFNKPTYVGVAVLELSKLPMYEFYYDEVKPKYGDNVELLQMDTDSFKLKIKLKTYGMLLRMIQN